MQTSLSMLLLPCDSLSFCAIPCSRNRASAGTQAHTSRAASCELVWVGSKFCFDSFVFNASIMLQHALRYTLGGFYLARYSDSPVGAFDEVD